MSEELWIIKGRLPVLWTIPVYAQWESKCEASVFPAIALLRSQERALNYLLSTHARKVKGMWLMTTTALEEVGRLADPGTDPESVFSWERPRGVYKPSYWSRARLIGEPLRKEFLDSLYQDGAGNSRDEVEHWWYIFCNYAFNWLINTEKPLDMYFVRLVPLPFRHEWVSILDSIHADKRQTEHFNDPYMLGGSVGNVIRRTIDAELLPTWWKSVRRVERTRLSRLTSEQYAESVRASIMRAIPAARRLYRYHVAKKTALRVGFRPGSIRGSESVVTFGHDKDRPDPRIRTHRTLKQSAAFFREFRKRTAKVVARKNAGLPTV